jgi:hypothetical protein
VRKPHAMAFLERFWFVSVLFLAALFAWLVAATMPKVALGQTPPLRSVTTGTLDTATSKDYRGTIVWRSPTAGAKTQRLPPCNQYNTGFWVQVVDGQATAAADPISITATTGSVTGPVVPVVIDKDRNSFVLTCDGGMTTWRVTAIAGVPGTVVTPPGSTNLVARNAPGGHPTRNGGGSVARN